VTHSTESTPPATEVVDLTKEGLSTNGTRRATYDTMDVDKERNKAKHDPKLELQLLTYTRGNSTESSTKKRSYGPYFLVE